MRGVFTNYRVFTVEKVLSKARELPAFREVPDKRTDEADRPAVRERGRLHFSSTFIYWLSKNNWSHPQFVVLSDWACREPGMIFTSQISHLRNAKMRMLGVKSIDALGWVNLATWAYHNDREILKDVGLTPVPAQIEELLKDAIAICDPETGAPLDQGGWMNLYLGYLQLPFVIGGAADEPHFEEVAEKIPGFISRVVQESGKTAIEAKQLYVDAMGSPEKAAKLAAVGAGLDTYSVQELVRDIEAICEAVSALQGKKWSVVDLATNIVSD